MTHIDDIKSKEELTLEIQTEIQALGVNLEHSLGAIKLFLLVIIILGIITLVHFW